METPANCQERACHDDITLGATGVEPGSGSIGALNSSPASNVSSDTAVTTAQKNTKDIQGENTNYFAAIAMLAAAPTPSMFKSQVTSFDPAVFWMTETGNCGSTSWLVLGHIWKKGTMVENNPPGKNLEKTEGGQMDFCLDAEAKIGQEEAGQPNFEPIGVLAEKHLEGYKNSCLKQ
ncbi:hypothetical protein TURU_086033 [Turdus rufiventris]|nr:hypothetical protein TURU_086033 [Turdus rufiventris]